MPLAMLTLAAVTSLGCASRPLEPRDPTPGAYHFTIQSFNMELRHWDDPATVAAIGAGNADIVCLQEATPRWVEVIEAAYREAYPHRLFHAPDEDTSGGLAVLSRFPLTDLGIAHEPNGWHPSWHVAVDTPGGRFQVLNVHLRAPFNGYSSQLTAYLSVEEDHLAQIQRVTSAVTTELPMLILGDFNETETGSAIRFLEERGFTTVLPLFHPGQWTWRYRHGSLANQFTLGIDHILADASFVPLDAHVLHAGNSDHIPVVAHFELARPNR